jgi:uncharacterized protein YuzE
MDTQIKRADWPAFADQFSQDNQGRPIGVEIASQALGDERMAEKVPLVAIDFDHQGQGTFLITLGQGEATMTHTILAPETVWVRNDPDGKALALEIVAADQIVVILRFEDA